MILAIALQKKYEQREACAVRRRLGRPEIETRTPLDTWSNEFSQS